MKMKNKLGTRQLPTAELLLDGCEVELAITFSGMGREGWSKTIKTFVINNLQFIGPLMFESAYDLNPMSRFKNDTSNNSSSRVNFIPENFVTYSQAQLMGVEGRGIACISNMLTVTRIHNSNSAVSAMR